MTVTEFLHQNVLFLAGVSLEDARSLAGCAEQLQVPAGQFVLPRWAPMEGLYVVATGKVAVVQDPKAGGSAAPQDLGPGDVFGESSLMGAGQATAGYQAREDALVFVIPAAAFGGVAQRCPAIMERARCLDAAPEPDLPKTFAKNYEVRRLIAEGGMGSVYEARDLMLDRTVAVKKMRPELRSDPKASGGFLHEARIVACLRHANIVEIFTIVEESGEIYLVFEYIDGPTVRELVHVKGRLDPGQCLRIVRQAGAAMEFAHARRVLHRDFKPSNVLLDSSGVVKVMDFGIARQAKTTLTKLSRTNPFGTLAYMAPEQHLGTEKQPADIYALGVSVYQMLSGKLPFAGPDFLGQKEKMDFAPLSRAAPDLGARFDALMARALAADPARRHAAAGEFLADFEDAMARP
ncbi:MAG: protein kinase [Elusimicrobia bacterium]|nr:protein kinase [Elusimicrobiota bacterium]